MPTTSNRSLVAWSAVAALAALTPACGFTTHGEQTGGGGPTGASSSSSTGSGAGGETAFCQPGSVSACYSGPPGTQGVGICKAGTRVCNSNGTGFGPCTGEALPKAEDCSTTLDDDCSGKVNDNCSCEPNTTQDCYSGPAGTEGMGPCKAGKQTCNANGLGFGPCMGEVVPQPEDCATDVDEDCDGKAFDDSEDGCVCDPAQPAVACYSGPAGTEGQGICLGGMESCNPDGKGMTGCLGEITPSPENCATGNIDEDCNGLSANDTAAGCVCDPAAAAEACTTTMLGVCAPGTRTCNASGMAYNTCVPDVAASTENCTTTMVDENCDGEPACNGASIVGKIKGAASKEDIAYGVAFDPSGNFFAGGIIDGTIAGGLFTAGSAWIAKYTGAGVLAWERPFAPTGAGAYAVAYGIATDSAGNVVAGGEYQGTLNFGVAGTLTSNGIDAFLVKLDPNGTTLWAKSFGKADTQAITSVAADSAGNLLICGGLRGVADFGGGDMTSAGSFDAFVAKLDANGNHVWSKFGGDAGYQVARGVAAAPNGDAVFVGEFDGNMDEFGGNLGGGGRPNVFVIRLQAANGNYVWGKEAGDGDDQSAYGVAVDAQDNIVVTGGFEGNLNLDGGNLPTTGSNATRDVFVVKYAGDGTHLWSKGFGTAGNQIGRGVAVDGRGNVVVTGFFAGTFNLGGANLVNADGTLTFYDVFVAKLDGSNGAHIWSKQAGDGANDQVGWGVAADALGNVVVGGGFRGTADFGAPVGTLTSAGGFDIFAVKLKP